MSIIVAIPAAGHIRDATSTETLQSPLLAIVEGRVFLHLILDRLASSGLTISEIRIGVTSSDIHQVTYLVNAYGSELDIRVIPCDDTKSGTETVQRLLREICAPSKVLVHLGDTLVDMEWSCVERFSSGLGVTSAEMELDRLSLTKYPSVAGSEMSEVRGLVGVYWFSFDQVIRREITGNSPIEQFVLSSDIEPYLAEVRTWIDADYSDRLNLANLTFESRNFNSVERVPRTNLLKKSSTNHEKLRREYDFVVGLEPEAAALFPSMRGFRLDGSVGSILMDYWPLPNLSDLYCFQNLSRHFCGSLMSQLANLMPILHGEPKADQDDLFSWAYFDKASQRLKELEESSSWFELFSNATEINGVFCGDPSTILAKARLAVQNFAPPEISRVHGDFCFSNILVDSDSMLVKLVDARGGFKEPGAQGPSSYDLAKLAHSVLGDYDLILKGFFKKTINGGAHNFHVSHPPHHAFMMEAFESNMKELGHDLDLLKLLSALILISIPPLHLENNERAQMFLLKGRLDATLALEALEAKASFA